MEKIFYCKEVAGENTETLVTSEFNITECQKDILSSLSKKILAYTEHGESLPLDKIKGFFCIKINYKDLGKEYDKDFVLDNLYNLLHRNFTLQKVRTEFIDYCHLFETIRETRNNNEIGVVLNSQIVNLLKNYRNEDVTIESQEK